MINTLLQYFIEQGADIHIGKDGPLSLSAENDQFGMVSYLLDLGIDNIHVDYEAAIRFSARNGHVYIVNYLLGSGADYRALDSIAFVR